MPAVLAGRDGELVQVADCAEGPRAVTVTPFVAGGKPRPPFDGALYRRFGVAVAELHEAALDFVTTAPRQPYDLARRLTGPARRVLDCGRLDPATTALVEDAAAITAERLSPLITGLDQGICHGDVTLDNLLLDGERLIIYDLDLAAPGWLVDDLTGVASTEHWPDFLAGYRSVRDFGDDQLEALVWLRIAAAIGNLEFHLITKPMIVGTESLGEGWVDGALDSLRELTSRTHRSTDLG